MGDYALLKAEVQRILALMGREHIDFLNFPFLQSALDVDLDYVDKMRHNIAELKCEGLIRFVNADNFPVGAPTWRWLSSIATCCRAWRSSGISRSERSPLR